MDSNNPQEPACILAIDDSEGILEIERAALESEGFTVFTASVPQDGVTIYRQHWPKIRLVLLDYNMSGMDGREVFQCLKQIHSDVNVCLVTSREDGEARRLLNEGVHWYIRKPFRLEEIVRCAEMVNNAVN